MIRSYFREPMNNSACPEVLEEVAALPAASLARLAAAREYSRFAAELSPETLQHLPSCDFCRAEIALLAGDSATLNALPAPALPPDFAARISAAIADIPQDAAVSPDILAAPQTPREYSQTSTAAPPDDAPTTIAPPLPRAEKRNWRARFGLEKIGDAPRRNMKIAWASGSVLAAFVLILATQIEPPAMLAPRRDSAVISGAPSPASTREETLSAKSGSAKSDTKLTVNAPSTANATSNKPNATRIKSAAPNAAQVPARDAATQNAPTQNVPRGQLVEPPAAPRSVTQNKSGGASSPREISERPALPQRVHVKPGGVAPAPDNAASKTAAAQKPRDMARRTSPHASQTTREKIATGTTQRVLAPPSPQSKAPATQQNDARSPDLTPGQVGALESRSVPSNDAPRRADQTATRAASNLETEAAPPINASPRDEARHAQKLRGSSARESREAAPPTTGAADANADAAAPSVAGSASSGAFSAPATAPRSRAEKAPISLHVSLTAPRDTKRARLRLELPRGAKLQTETPDNMIWSGTLKRGENAIADLKIVEEENVSPRRARAVLESRARDGWRVLATKNIKWKAP